MILAVVASLIGIIPNWPGTAIVSVTALTEVNFTAGSMDWGAGRVNSGESSATLYSDIGTVTGGSWTPNSGELILENIGSDNVILHIYSDKDADALVGGTASINSFQWKMAEIESGSCVNITDTSWTNVNTTSPGTRLCDIFYAADASDSIKIDFTIVIPSDTTVSGAQSATITATATLI